MIRSLLSFATLLLASSTHVAQAQSEPAATPHRPALLRVGVGASLNGSGDYAVLKTHLEYAPQFGQHWRSGSRVALVSGFERYYFGYGYSIPQSYRALNIEQEVYWLPFGANKTVEFSVGAGAYGGYSQQKGWQQAGIDANQNFRYVALNERGFHVGYIASLNIDFALNQERTWRLGGRLALQNDTRANILPGAQLLLSRAW